MARKDNSCKKKAGIEYRIAGRCKKTLIDSLVIVGEARGWWAKAKVRRHSELIVV
jgi:hypothetical protein